MYENDNIDEHDIYQANNYIRLSAAAGVVSLFIMGGLIYLIYNAFSKLIYAVIAEASLEAVTEEDFELLAKITDNKDMIVVVAVVIIGLIFFLAPLIRTLSTISRCSAASRNFASSGNTGVLAECAAYLRKKYLKTFIAFFVFGMFLISSLSDGESVLRTASMNINLGFVILFLPALFHIFFASKAAKLCGGTARTVTVQRTHNDRCGERDHHYDYVDGDQKDCYGKHKYDSYSEYESYSDDYDYFENDDRFKIDMSRYDFSSGYDTHYTDTDKH